MASDSSVDFLIDDVSDQESWVKGNLWMEFFLAWLSEWWPA